MKLRTIAFGKLANFIIQLKQVDLRKDDYIIIYSKEKNVYSSFKRSELEKLEYYGFINIVGVLRRNVITNELYFTRWQDLTCHEQDVLFEMAINIKNKE